ncbi:DUF4097 family beta strand repeat-containing protein [Parabacteroides pacaensis]|uniref:DUF4097 family beta strand repeat-containing protein n=1 Tax=Parabacteroides pacaensis TaxID=2086575 RepID=UPI000D0F8BC4|nr:DUF4097 family beta strand repeat-containing protein [Parabacteroides pacaensis]
MQAISILKQITGICVLFFLSTSVLLAGNMDYSQKKEMTKSFSANKNTTLSVNNRFGNIVLEHWEKNEVKIRVVIESKADSHKTAESNLDKVSVRMNKKGNTIEAITQMSNLDQRDNERVRVDYTLLIPSDIKLNLEQQFGNITLPESHQGVSSFIIKFGNIVGGNFTAPVYIESQFSNVTLGNLTSVEMELKHSEKVRIANAEDVNVECQFSNLKAGNLQNIKLNERHSNIEIKSCNHITMDVQHSEITIHRLKTSAEIASLSHSTLEIKDLSGDFAFLRATASFGNIKLKLPTSASFQLDANTSFGDIKIDPAFKLENQTYIEKNNKKDISAYVNGGKNGHVEFNGSFSTITIKEL